MNSQYKQKVGVNMNIKNDYTLINSKTWDKWADNGCEWSKPISQEEYVKAQNGEWGIYLTPCKFVPKEWFGALDGSRVLCLASGGGQQMPILTALGAKCTVFDYSDSQLDKERLVAEREGYSINIVKGDMTKPLPFENESFDLIFHPVSNCYIEKVYHVWNECYRVLKHGGILLAGFDNGLNFLFNDDGTLPLTVTNKLPFNPLEVSEEECQRMAENYEGIQFSHSLEEQIGGQLKSGFILTDLYEDRDREGCGVIREYAPQYIATRAVKP
jgi:SAM-dependent methyltransferase